MLIKLATKNYPKIPKRFLFAVGEWLIFGILWVSLPVNIAAASDSCVVEKNSLSMASVMASHCEPVSHQSTVIVGEYGAPLWTGFSQTDFESIFWGASFFIFFSFIYLILTIFIRGYITNIENYYSVLLNWMKSVQASTS